MIYARGMQMTLSNSIKRGTSQLSTRNGPTDEPKERHSKPTTGHNPIIKFIPLM